MACNDPRCSVQGIDSYAVSCDRGCGCDDCLGIIKMSSYAYKVLGQMYIDAKADNNWAVRIYGDWFRENKQKGWCTCELYKNEKEGQLSKNNFYQGIVDYYTQLAQRHGLPEDKMDKYEDHHPKCIIEDLKSITKCQNRKYNGR